jgi:hypothetical protein
VSELPLDIPRGLGLRRLGLLELKERPSLLDTLLIFEPPRRGTQHRDVRYIISADISDGIGQDRTSIDVLRIGTIEEPAEQVAHFFSDTRTPTQAAYVIDLLGHYYADADGLEALVAVECNNHGLSTQDTLQLHLGYSHFYRWEILDAFDRSKRFRPTIGWTTTPRTRPIILDKLYEAITTLDPLSGLPDYRINSPHTLNELADFQTEGALWEAEASRGAHDDAVLSSAIGYYVAWRQAGGEHEPLADRRRRRAEEKVRAETQAGTAGRDYRNTAYTFDEIGQEESDDDLHYGVRIY